MRLLKNKKGFDWSFLIVGVTILCLVFLYFQLDKKMSAFDPPIGKMQMDLIDKIQQSENLLFYIDESSRLAACDTVYELGRKGGFYQSPCGETPPMPVPGLLTPVSFNYWYKDGRKCYENVNFYKEFTKEFSTRLTSHMSKYNYITGESVFLLDNHEFMITDNKVVGSAIKNINLEFVSTGGGIGIGKYSFKPSFAIDFKTGLGDYLKLATAVDELVSCESPMQECVDDLNTPGLKWDFQKIGLTTYTFSVEQDIQCRFKGGKPKIMFAIERPLKVPEVITPTVAAPPIPPVPPLLEI